ncbi:MAG: glutaminyl-peptide cyclotransferase [Dehalococcoidia bacterium]|nr:glutaminyl-peptide cyclotransferase [Dehalococcoidia bacterium]
MSLFEYRYRLCLLFLWLLVTLAISSCSSQSQSISQPVPIYTYKIENTYPHNQNAFTEGLAFNNGFLYESTGLYGNSSLRKVDLATADVLQLHKLPIEYFGEGIAVYDDTIIQLTWQSHTGFIYNKDGFGLLRQFSYPTEGWGITYDGKRLIMSDGTSILHFLNPKTMESIGSIEVREDNEPVNMLNELEYVNGKVYANVWKTDRIAIIEPQDGRITGWIDLSGLLRTQDYSGHVDVLNGIAYDAQADRLFVTGKLWPFLFEIKLVADE